MNNNTPIFSLVVPTLGRPNPLMLFLDSLTKQKYNNFEVILVDQNETDEVSELLQNYSDKLLIKHIRSSIKGLSVNRNIGLKTVQGKIICFPDDDCTYETDTLQKVKTYFEENTRNQIYSCCVKDKKLDKRFDMYKKDTALNKYNFFDKTISIGIFIKPKSITDIVFDERLGVGAQFGSAEESDLISHLLELGYKGDYFSNDFVYHEYPSKIPTKDRYLNYSSGLGAFWKKEIFLRKKYLTIVKATFSLLLRLAFSLIPWKKRKFMWYSFKGQLTGLLKY